MIHVPVPHRGEGTHTLVVAIDADDALLFGDPDVAVRRIRAKAAVLLDRAMAEAGLPVRTKAGLEEAPDAAA